MAANNQSGNTESSSDEGFGIDYFRIRIECKALINSWAQKKEAKAYALFNFFT